ncbi:MAG TPA: hypothetical protein VHL11_06815 [Phototrophicaceae bacterium]|jgi:hypothetical protein|nr:hypothetical protein [Phototrophicaceae bacterium]
MDHSWRCTAKMTICFIPLPLSDEQQDAIFRVCNEIYYAWWCDWVWVERFTLYQRLLKSSPCTGTRCASAMKLRVRPTFGCPDVRSGCPAKQALQRITKKYVYTVQVSLAI